MHTLQASQAKQCLVIAAALAKQHLMGMGGRPHLKSLPEVDAECSANCEAWGCMLQGTSRDLEQQPHLGGALVVEQQHGSITDTSCWLQVLHKDRWQCGAKQGCRLHWPVGWSTKQDDTCAMGK